MFRVISSHTRLIVLLALVIVIYFSIRLTRLPGLEEGRSLIFMLTPGEPDVLDLNGDDVKNNFLKLAARCSLSYSQGERILDSRGDYEIVYDLATPLEKPGPSDVTLLTQCSHDNLKDLISLVARWQGPISVAVYTENDDVAEALWDIASLIACDAMIRMHDFLSFAKRNKLLDNPKEAEGKVFVVPVLEVKSEVCPPSDKNQLISLIDSGVARPFYAAVCSQCQRETRYEAWQKIKMSPQLSPLYEVTWNNNYEPFFIAPKEIPLFDERFRQFGFDRISQTCELHIAGYVFAILNNAFLIHQGWKTNASFHQDLEKDMEQNGMRFDQFSQELRIKYPESPRQCSREKDD